MAKPAWKAFLVIAFLVLSVLVGAPNALAAQYRTFEYFEGLPLHKEDGWQGYNYHASDPIEGGKSLTLYGYPWTDPADGQSYTCVGWKSATGSITPASGDINRATFTLNADSSITWIYKKAHEVSFTVSPMQQTLSSWGGGVTEPPTAPAQWHSYNGHEYALTPAMPWGQAEAYAVSHGAHLVTVNDHVEHSWIINTFGSSESLWIGHLQDPGSGEPESGWHWVSGETPGYTNWYDWPSGEPNDMGGNEDYVVMLTAYDMAWDDVSGALFYRGIMERPEGADVTWAVVAAGANHTVALKADGTLWVWGENDYGQLGLGDNLDRPVPTPMWHPNPATGHDYALTPALHWAQAEAYAVSRGAHLVTINDEVENGWLVSTFPEESENLWIGFYQDTSDPNFSEPDGGWKWVSGETPSPWFTNWSGGEPNDFGSDHATMRLNGGGDWDDDFGNTKSYRGIMERPEINWTAVAAGRDHTLAIRSDGTLWAWGYNDGGQLGLGDNNDRTTPSQVGRDDKWVAVYAEGGQSFGLKSDGTLWAWGENQRGQLGLIDTVVRYAPTQVQPGTTWLTVAAGRQHTLGIKSDGSLWAWGKNQRGQLGLGYTDDSEDNHGVPTRVVVGPPGTWKAVAAGESHSLAIREDGTLWAWGFNNYGQLGTAITNPSPSPGWILNPETYNEYKLTGYLPWYDAEDEAVSLGAHLVTVNNVDEWNWLKQHFPPTERRWIGLSDYGEENVFKWVNGEPYNETYRPWGAGQPDDNDKTAVCMNTETGSFNDIGGGSNWFSGIMERPAPSATPLQIGWDKDWASVAAGHNHTVAIKTDGTIWAWGLNDQGQLGLGDTNNRDTPTKVNQDTDWVSVTAGLSHTVAIRGPARFELEPHMGPKVLPEGTAVTASAKVTPTDGQGAYNLTSFASVPGMSGASFTVESGVDFTWTFAQPRTVNVTVSGLPSNASNAADAFPAIGDNRFTEGSKLTLHVEPVVTLDTGTVYVCTGWTGGSGDVPASGAASEVPIGSLGQASSITWNYAEARSLTTEFDGLPEHLQGDFGHQFAPEGQNSGWDPDGPVWSAAGSSQELTPTEYIYDEGGRVRYALDLDGSSATGDLDADADSKPDGSTITFTADENSTVTWAYKKQLRLKVGVEGLNNTADAVADPPVGDTYYEPNAFVTVSALAQLDLDQDGNMDETCNELLVLSGSIGSPPAQVADAADGRKEANFLFTEPTEISWSYEDAERWVIGRVIDPPAEANGDVRPVQPADKPEAFFWDGVNKKLYPVQPFASAILEWTSQTPNDPKIPQTGYSVWPSDATLWAWGQNSSGQLGDNSTTPGDLPLQVGSGKDWKAVSAGPGTDANHTVAVAQDGTLWAWGSNPYGELGLGTSDSNHHPTPTQIEPDDDWTAVAAGVNYTLALKQDGTLWAWGLNDKGQLGVDDTDDKDTPTKVGSDSDWIAVTAGKAHTLALKQDGTLWAWGSNNEGQLGVGGTDNKNTPTQVGSDADWIAVAAGSVHTLALKKNGTLHAWGYNETGAAGGSGSNGWVAIAAGDAHSMGIKSDGTLWTWGLNNWGQLGLDDTVNRSEPTQVGTATGWVAIAAGRRHSLAVRAGGTLWAWGLNDQGQLGLGASDSDPHQSLTRVGTDIYWSSVAAGSSHTVALKSTLQKHVAGTPANLQPLDNQNTFEEMHYSEAYGAGVPGPTTGDPVFDPTGSGKSLLRFSTGDGDPPLFVVVNSVDWETLLWTGQTGGDAASIIGEDITPPNDITHDDPEGKNGYVFFEKAYYDGTGDDSAYDRSSREGQIIPVNETTVNTPSDRQMVVVWYETGAAGAGWPVMPVRYECQWPQNPEKIIIAGGNGSEPLLEYEYLGKIYVQPEVQEPGYNPNEEHALLLGNKVFALRNDLNTYQDGGTWKGPLASEEKGTSQPFVLLKYWYPDTESWKMKVYRVEKTDSQHTFTYAIAAGSSIIPLTPMDVLPKPQESQMASGADWYHQDHKGGHWARAASQEDYNTGDKPVSVAVDDLNNDTFLDLVVANAESKDVSVLLGNGDGTFQAAINYPLANSPESVAVHDHDSNLGLDLIVDCGKDHGFYALLGNDDGTFQDAQIASVPPPINWGTPAAQVDVDNDGILDLVVASETSDVVTVRLGNAQGYFEGSVITMHWYYPLQHNFYYPFRKADGSPVGLGDPIPFLNGGSSHQAPPADVAYVAHWPGDVKTLNIGETLTGTKYGLPDIVNWAAGKVIFDENVQDGGGPLARLFDPYTERSVPLSALPDGLRTENVEGKRRFPDLPYSLRSRLFYDPTNEKLIFKGISYDPGIGEPLLLPNIMTVREKERLIAFEPYWGNAVRKLFDETRKYIAGSQKLVGVPMALSAGAADGQGYVVLAQNDDESLAAEPVALCVIKVAGGPYRGEITVISPDDVFDEKLTLRHSGDFGGAPEKLYFAWYYKPDNSGLPPRLPESPTDTDGWLLFDAGQGMNDITIEGAGKLTLSDNWFMVHYYYGDQFGDTGAGYPALAVPPSSGSSQPMEDTHNWSPWSGAPGEETAQLAPGWIKRVVADLNPLDARVKDFRNYAVSTDVSMVTQLGERYEGDIALNGTPENLNTMGLIEAYETVMGRAKDFSIDASPPSDYGPVNNAILNAGTRIADFYTLLGNEAYADAQDPTIGFDTQSGALGSMASAIFAFQNQLSSLLEEELALLRGRDDAMSTTRARPLYNRLAWNFTQGDGELAYAQAYNIRDMDGSGVVDELDAKAMYPQGHGDAWGHYLTAIKVWYGLLRHENFTWEPRIESVLVGGAPIPVDYLDERKFAETAAAKARAGAEIVNLTYRRAYVEDPAGQWQGYKDTDTQRAWGVDGWARRAGQGAFFDWAVANAMLPSEDPVSTHTGIQKIDRSTVPELAGIAAEFQAVQSQADRADRGLNPLGLAKGVVPFDVDPNFLQVGSTVQSKTHFEQVYDRAIGALENARTVFDYATQYTLMLRQNEDSQVTFKREIEDQERGYTNRLIEIFGYPYAGDIGPAGTFKSGYNGPDLFHFLYVDLPDLTGEPLMGEQVAYTYTFNFDDPDFQDDDAADPLLKGLNVTTETNPETGAITPSVEITYHIDSEAPWLSVPAGWGKRRAPGEIQMAISELIKAHASYKQGLSELEGLIGGINAAVDILEAKHGVKTNQIEILNSKNDEIDDLEDFLYRLNSSRIAMEALGRALYTIAEDLRQSPSEKGNFLWIAYTKGELVDQISSYLAVGSLIPTAVAYGLEGDIYRVELEIAEKERERDRSLFIADARFEVQQMVKELETMEGDVRAKLQELYGLREVIHQCFGRYQAALAEGERLLSERDVFRKRAAADVQDYRYQDLGFRTFRNDAVQKYRATFELAARYAYLAATAYDYETNLLGSETASGRAFLTDIVKQRSPGVVMGGQPVVGKRGLADPLARLSQNFGVYKGQLGFNNPQIETNRFGLRKELFRFKEGSDPVWRAELGYYRLDDLWQFPPFKRFCRPFADESVGPQPGLVIPFSTEVSFGYNFFGWPLGGGDSAYDPSNFATKIRSVGVWFKGYENAGLSSTPRVYLVPVGADVLRAPGGNDFTTREWHVVDQKLPVPFPVSDAELYEENWMPVNASLSDTLGGIRRFSSFRAFPDSSLSGKSEAEIIDNQSTTDTRLIGRSVWNTQWLLIIPGGTLLNDPDAGLDSFIDNVTDIKLFFQTYAYSGN